MPTKTQAPSKNTPQTHLNLILLIFSWHVNNEINLCNIYFFTISQTLWLRHWQGDVYTAFPRKFSQINYKYFPHVIQKIINFIFPFHCDKPTFFLFIIQIRRSRNDVSRNPGALKIGILLFRSIYSILINKRHATYLWNIHMPVGWTVEFYEFYGTFENEICPGSEIIEILFIRSLKSFFAWNHFVFVIF